MAEEAPRKWTDVKHEATFVSLFQSGTKVKLRYAHNGSIVAVQLDRLSEADKAYVRDAVARSKQKPGAEKEEMIDPSLPRPASLIASAMSPLAYSPQSQPNAGGYLGNQNLRANPPLAQSMPPPSNYPSTVSYPMPPASSGQASAPARQNPALSSGYYQNPVTANVASTNNNAAFSAMQPVSYSIPSPPSSAGSGNSSPVYRNSIVLPQSTTKVAASVAPAVSRPESHHSPQSQTPAPQQQPAVSSAPTTPNSGFAQQHSSVPQQRLVPNPASAPYSTATQQQPVVSPTSAPHPTASNSSSTRQFTPTPQQQQQQQQQPVVSPSSTPYPTTSNSASTRQYTPTPQQLAVSPASTPYPTASNSASTRQYTPAPQQQQPVVSPASAPYPTASDSSSARQYTATHQQQPAGSPASAPYPTASNSGSLRVYSTQPPTAPISSPAFMGSTPPSSSSAVAAAAATHRPPSNPTTTSVAAVAVTHRPPSNPTTTPVAAVAATHRPPSNPTIAPVAAAAATHRPPSNSTTTPAAVAEATYPPPSNHATTFMATATHRPPSNPTATYPQSPAQQPDFGKATPMPNPALAPVAAQQQQLAHQPDNSRPQAHVDAMQADRQIYAPALSTAAQTITTLRTHAPGFPNKPAPTPQTLQTPQNSQNLQSQTQTADVSQDVLYDELLNSVTLPATKVTRTPSPAPSASPAPSTAAAILHSNAITRVAKAPPRTTAAQPAQGRARPTFQALPQDVFVRITQYLDMRSLVNLYRTSKAIHTMLRENPECWQYITFAPSYLERVDHKFVEAMIAWLTRERFIHYVHSIVYNDTKVQELTVVQTLERFPALEHMSIERCWDVYSYPLANLLTVRNSHRSMHLAMLKSFHIGNSLYRGSIPQGFAVIAESKSFGQDVGLIDQAITQLAGHDVQFDVYLCENCDTGPCHPIFKCTFCGNVPVKKCWLCTPKCDRCGTRACGEASCKRDWQLSTEHRCGRCTVPVRLCTNRGCVKTPTCNQCGRYFHGRCSFETSNMCGLCEKTVCPFCDLDVCAECKGQWCRKNRCSEVVSCQCGKDKVVCQKDIKRCGTKSCREMAFCSKCLEQHKQKTGHDA